VIAIERAKSRYILAKSFPGGNTYACNQISIYKRKFKFIRLKTLFGGVIGTVLILMQAIILIYYRKEVVRNFGKVFVSLNMVYKHFKI